MNLRKKLLISIIFCAFGLSSIYSAFEYDFEKISLNPIYKEYFADRTRADMSITTQFFLEGTPDRVLQETTDNNGVHSVNVFEFGDDFTETGAQTVIKVGETVSFARSTFTFDSFLSPIAFDFSFQGVIQSFYTNSFNYGIGYDGIYFFGGTFRIADVLSMRIGQHHYCSHYGDAIYKLVDKKYGTLDDFNLTYKYIRMNPYVIGLSLEPTSNFRIYGELNFPGRNIVVLRPFMFGPTWYERAQNDYGDDYNARIVNVGFEISANIFKNLGKTTVGYDLHMYEEGKIYYDHVNGGSIEFRDDEPWEMEHDVRIAQDIGNSLSLEISYHNGRSPFNNFYFLHTELLGIGLRFNP